MFKHTFENKYGMSLVNAVFAINIARVSKSNDFSISLDLNKGAERQQTETSHSYVNYDVVYWIDQAAKDAGSQPLSYETDPNMPEANLSFAPDDGVVIETAEQLEAECEAHFKKNILEIEA